VSLVYIDFIKKELTLKPQINGAFPYPMNIMMPMMKMDAMLCKDLQKGL